MTRDDLEALLNCSFVFWRARVFMGHGDILVWVYDPAGITSGSMRYLMEIETKRAAGVRVRFRTVGYLRRWLMIMGYLKNRKWIENF